MTVYPCPELSLAQTWAPSLILSEFQRILYAGVRLALALDFDGVGRGPVHPIHRIMALALVGLTLSPSPVLAHLLPT